MFTYTCVRPGDKALVVYDHQTTLTQVLARRSPNQALALASEMLHSLLIERNAFRAEYYDRESGLRLTLERVGVKHAYNDVSPDEEVVLP